VTSDTKNPPSTRLAAASGKTSISERLYTVNEVAERVRVDPTTVRRWIRHGLIVCIDLPHTGTRVGRRIPQSTLDGILTSLPALPSDKEEVPREHHH
jgi:excisionase family DNA binding protein